MNTSMEASTTHQLTAKDAAAATPAGQVSDSVQLEGDFLIDGGNVVGRPLMIGSFDGTMATGKALSIQTRRPTTKRRTRVAPWVRDSGRG